MATATATQAAPFTWEGKDRTGKTVKGKVVSTSEAAVRSELRRRASYTTRVRKQSMLFRKQGKVTAGDIAIFARQLATMRTAGIPSCAIVRHRVAGHGTRHAEVDLAIKGDVEGGTSLHEALAKHPLHFDDLFVSLVSAGEQAGALETLLDKIATYKEKTGPSKEDQEGLVYPAAVVGRSSHRHRNSAALRHPRVRIAVHGFGADLPAFTAWSLTSRSSCRARAGCCS